MNLKPACLLLSLCHAGSAVALGLGDINVHSFLGQPLHATVSLLGSTPETTAACFSLGANPGSIAPPLRAQMSLERSGSQTLLHIRTPQAVHEPIAQFVLVSDCEARLQREYVVLLDPPALTEPVISGSPAPVAAAMTPVPVAAAVTSARPNRVKRAAAATAAHPSEARRERPMPVAATPHLVLSGKHGDAHNPMLSLRFDRNLPDLTRPRPENLTATELSDENTALTRKLAHLEAELSELRLRNAELNSRHSMKPAATAPAAPNQPAQWPTYLLAAGLLTGGGALAAWLRRRSRKRQPINIQDDMSWTSVDSLPKLPESAKADNQQPVPRAETPPPPERVLEYAPPTLAESSENTEIKDDILDQAEVYMAHGHGELAIHLLQEHLREAPDESPVPWLLLLDLLHRDGNMEGYAAARDECRRHFNINLSGHPVSQDDDQGVGLEAYPHLVERLVEVWRSPQLDEFFHELIYDNRGGTRMGFEPGAYRDILMLRAVAKDALPLAA